MTTVVVSGAPGTGKSTVAAAVAGRLGWPLVSLDTIKEVLADALGLGDEAWSDQLGDAAAEVVFRLVTQFPDVVVEGWWRRDRRDRALVELAGAVEVFCWCAPEEALRRMRERIGAGRHPIHRDAINPALLDRSFDNAVTVTPLGLGAALVEIDTGRPGAAERAAAEAAALLGRSPA